MASLIIFYLFVTSSLCFVDVSLTQTIQALAVDTSRQQNVAALSVESVRLTDDLNPIRKQRSSFYNDDEDDDDDNDYGGYSDGPGARHLKHGHKKKKQHKPLLLELLGGQGGCRGYSCGGGQGWKPQTNGHNQGSHGGQGGTFASASAGSVGGSPHHGEGQSQASAQSASFNFGPYSATFSVAQASSAGNRQDGIRDYYDY